MFVKEQILFAVNIFWISFGLNWRNLDKCKLNRMLSERPLKLVFHFGDGGHSLTRNFASCYESIYKFYCDKFQINAAYFHLESDFGEGIAC